MPSVPASRTSSGYGSAPVYDSACSDSRPTCGPLPCTTTTVFSAARGAIASAAILTFRRCTSEVIGSLRRSTALPPTAITIRILSPPQSRTCMLFERLRCVVTHPGVIPTPYWFSDFGDNDDGKGDGRADEPMLDVEMGGIEERLEGAEDGSQEKRRDGRYRRYVE